MSQVRCRCFQDDEGVDKVRWYDMPAEPNKDPVQKRVTGWLVNAACEFLSSLPQSRIVAVTEGTSSFGMRYIHVYYREEVSVAAV